jgi:carbonic anhydrase
MCTKCGNLEAIHLPVYSRRNFLKFSGVAALGVAVSRQLFAASDVKPKPQNVLTPDEALHRLKQGNQRYIQGVMKRHDFAAERAALAGGQNPYAGILSCADSRIAPEYAFDTGRGDLFVVRVAGNFTNEDVIASFEYAVQFLGTPLLVVLGHEKCGAVDAAIKTVKDGAKLPGHLPAMMKKIAPAVQDVMGQPGDLLANAIRKNVMLNVEHLKKATPVISKFVEEGKVRVVGGIYRLEDGSVEWVG